MVGHRERARLIATWGHEPLYAAGALVKCVACLLILCGLAVIGFVSEPSSDEKALRAPSHQAARSR